MTDLQVRSRSCVPGRVFWGPISIRASLAGGKARTKLARFYVGRLLPEHIGLLHAARQGAEDVTRFPWKLLS